MGSNCVSPRYLQGVSAPQPCWLWVMGAVCGLRALPGCLLKWLSTLILQGCTGFPVPGSLFHNSVVTAVGRCGTGRENQREGPLEVKGGDGSYLGRTLACHGRGGGSRERASNIPFSLYCCVLSIEKYRHTQTHVQPLPIPFITVSSFLNECLGGEKSGGNRNGR